MFRLHTSFTIFIWVLSFSAPAQPAHPPIAIPFYLGKSGYVTLVLEDQQGRRVRNILADTWFKAGKNVTWWDGTDDLGRDLDAAKHGVYHIPGQLVPAGGYVVRGIVHPAVKATYQLSVYAPGDPPWPTTDHRGGWLANHSAPQAAVAVPAEESPSGQPLVFLGSYVTEGPDGFAWVDLNGKKLGGKKWVGGEWTAAPFIARDAGKQRMKGNTVYIASLGKAKGSLKQVVLRISAFPRNMDVPLCTLTVKELENPKEDITAGISGFAVYNGLAVVSLRLQEQVAVIDLKTCKLLASLNVVSPSGLAFDKHGDLLVLSGNKMLRYIAFAGQPAQEPVLLTEGRLDAPVGITTDGENRIYVSNNGRSQQIVVFDDTGKFLHTIGEAGLPQAGPYHPEHMNNPAGITIDANDQLWVAENDFLPKRVSVWTLDGKFIKAFYGPAKYGGGGTLDPQDKHKFYYAEQDLGTMEFSIDWTTGQSKLEKVLYRKMPGSLSFGFRNAGPETPLYFNGKRYFTNAYNAIPTNGALTATLFIERSGILQPVAAMGRADNWDLFNDAGFSSRLPPGVRLGAKGTNGTAFFIWTDKNEDARVQPEEVIFSEGEASGVTVLPDLSFCVANLSGSTRKYAPVAFSTSGIPQYVGGKSEVLATGVLPSGSSGGNQVLNSPDGWTIITTGISPFGPSSLSGTRGGRPMWSYPDMWPGLHASHSAPLPQFRGQLIGTTHLLGGFFNPLGTSESLWAINSNHGMIYLFTEDGLFVTTLFEPMRTGRIWNMQAPAKGMDMEGLTLGEENFWPTITQTKDGEIFLMDGNRSSLLKLSGLEGITRIQPAQLEVTQADLRKSAVYLKQNSQGSMPVTETQAVKVKIDTQPYEVDGKIDDWKSADWVNIDHAGIKAYFNATSGPYAVSAAVGIAGGTLYAAYRTGDPDLLKNSGELPLAPFKTGGALDLMIQTPGGGNMRILVTVIRNRTYALLYETVVPETKEIDRVPFSSPLRTVTFDRVTDISADIQLASGRDGNYELAIPLRLLSLKPAGGLSIRGDIGILRGDGSHTLSRVYWHNKATALVSDLPSEAELVPENWGTFTFEH